ncbi:type I restriction enzyme HsdR N-terminal domain-containing protein [Desulforhopalus sp. IMCC35007]|uniref:type I restriction enzyme HsdR N-terminal domain-containing protein n=1 Tax=Desulforhopalus sp. IMCC35007 TaxID=2569543 RepID=UPI0010AEC9E6|nr:type I restriction enzyme HsdR N-terminal domain-containing protein [Desulforhopalus sp. IMCC35007]TKB11588.1 type I restriction enzyme HsdR N-terminal domain-containing protein [Desulforhopalus sp. IMCC35007]
MPIPKPHHLIYGTLKDYLTGDELTDTDDERIRQELCRMMVEEKGYSPDQLQTRLTIETLFSRCFVTSTIELTVFHQGLASMILRYGPGSLVSRERSAIAAARVLVPDHQIPLAIVTNGRDAELLDTKTGKILGYGLHSIPDSETLPHLLENVCYLKPLEGKRRERELRILNAFDVERCCY